MLVVGCRDDDSVDVLAGKQVLIIFIDIYFHLLFAFRLVVFLDATHETVTLDVIDVAACQHPHIVKCHKGAQQIHRLLTQTDEAEVQLAVGRLRGRWGRSC